MERGGFDLSKHPADQGRAIANHFIEMEEKLVDITDAIELWKRAYSFKEFWLEAIEKGELYKD